MHRPASPHFVTECKNRGMMRRTKYVVVHFFPSNKVERALGKTDTVSLPFLQGYWTHCKYLHLITTNIMTRKS